MRSAANALAGLLLTIALVAIAFDPTNGVVDAAPEDPTITDVSVEIAPTTSAREREVAMAAPTTAAPTTLPPTTVAPTTLPPTTVPPTTAAPITAAPTTVPPTTVAPTTVPPTTAAPTTTEAPQPVAAENPNGGVIISPKGIPLPVIEKLADGWEVETPCGYAYEIAEGTHVGHADFVIDPGHGGVESGAVGPNGLTEKELNLDVANRVKNGLEALGYTVVMTRTTDVRIPLRARAHIANALEPHALISVHHNGGATMASSTPGSEVFYDYGAPESKRLSGIMYEELVDGLSAYPTSWVRSVRRGVQARLNKDGSDLYGIHRYTPKVISVIAEALWLSNGPEAEVLMRDDVRQAEADAIVRSITRWRTTADPGSGFNPDFVDGSSSGTGGYDNCEDPAL